jgi:hypothetical protein
VSAATISFPGWSPSQAETLNKFVFKKLPTNTCLSGVEKLEELVKHGRLDVRDGHAAHPFLHETLLLEHIREHLNINSCF